jgi:hypothetical protein
MCSIKKLPSHWGLTILVISLNLSSGCSESQPPATAGDLTGQLHSGTTSARVQPPAKSTPHQTGATTPRTTPDSTSPEAEKPSTSAVGDSVSQEPAAETSHSGRVDPTIPANDAPGVAGNAPESESTAPQYLKVQVVQAARQGALDVYVTNTWDQNISDCVMVPFEGIEIKLAALIQPGQVTMCGLEGEVPEQLTFRADQFESFQCDFPETLQELDVSRFDWATMDQPESGTADDSSHTQKKSPNNR